MATKTIGQLTQATTINNADEFAIEQSGVTKRIAASVVRGDIVNANISASAAIDGSKLANSSVTPTKLSQPYTLATAQASTSGTSIDFTGIPSWAKRITVMFNGVSTNGSSVPIVQLGSSSFATSGYLGAATQVGSTANTTTTTAFTTGVPVVGVFGATSVIRGVVSLVNVTGNTWVGTSVQAFSDAAVNAFSASNVTLSGTLDRVRITTVNGTDTFDAGTINIAYEG